MRGWLRFAALATLCVPTPCSADARAIGVRLMLGAGAGTRAFVLPSATGVGTQALATSPFAAVALDLTVRIRPEQRVGVDVLASYHSSLAWMIEQKPLFALPQDIAVRSQRLELSLAPTLRLTQGEPSHALAFPLGFGLRSFWPRLGQFPVPAFSLGGPLLRVQLQLAFFRGLRVRVGPELQWLLLSSSTRPSAGVDALAGYALGIAAELDANIARSLQLGLGYRESRATLPTRSGALEDTERYVTVRLVGEL